MAYKVFLLDDKHKVTIYKRRKARNLRLSIDDHGDVRVSIPVWAPYKSGLDFAKSKQNWIESHQTPHRLLMPGQAIGKAHHLSFIKDDAKLKATSRVNDTSVMIYHHPLDSYSEPVVQLAAQKASLRALKKQAEALLPQRLETLAAKHGFTYNAVSVKQMKSRWGSCDQNRDIVLNIFLMQVPWELIDYVLLHELTHTQVLKHGPVFWKSMEKVLPNVKSYKKRLRSYQPMLNGSSEPAMA